jgi:cytochrome c553
VFTRLGFLIAPFADRIVDAWQARFLGGYHLIFKIGTIALLTLLLGATAWADSPEEIWKEKGKCTNCHGDDGRGKTKIGKKEKIPDLTSTRWQSRHSDEQIKDTITNGSEDNPKMKPFKDKLTPEEIDSMVKFVRGLKAPAGG